MTKEMVFEKVKEILVQDFELEPEAIKPDARLAENLDLDSIDAVDMIVKLKTYTSAKIDPALFKNVKTVQDVVDIIFPLIKEGD